MNRMLLADIGNTHFHIYDGKKVEHLSYTDAIAKYKEKEICYISVKKQGLEQIASLELWKNISSFVHIDGEYETMGVDRKSLCLSHNEGVFVDAGSAITVDIVEKGSYQGGFILPGLHAFVKCYGGISPALETTLDKTLDLEHLASTTKEQISYGIIASIKALIKMHSQGKTLYFTGGDGKFLSSLFVGAKYDETLVFQGMIKTIKDKKYVNNSTS